MIGSDSYQIVVGDKEGMWSHDCRRLMWHIEKIMGRIEFAKFYFSH